MHTTPAILYIGYTRGVPLRCRRLDGIRRFAKAHGWEVVTIHRDGEKNPDHLRKTLDRLAPIGCIRECHRALSDLPPDFFSPIPLVCFDPPERREWRGVTAIRCDESAVAKAAYGELSLGLPPSFAVVSHGPARNMRWARERVEAFTALCRGDGKPCSVFPELSGEDDKSRFGRLTAWIAALPMHCAVFAVSDYAVHDDIARAFAAAYRSLPHTATLVSVDAAEAPGEDDIAAGISSVRLDFELSGYLAAKALLAQMGGSRSRAGDDTPLFGPLLVERRKSTCGRGRRESFVLEAVEAIRREACDGLTAAALAARQTGSRRNFDRRFREAVGHSVLEEIRQVRLERVLTLLSNTNTPFGVISDMCGFGSEVELRQVFKARFGVSMTQWRTQHR